jgi:hypothetical protein
MEEETTTNKFFSLSSISDTNIGFPHIAECPERGSAYVRLDLGILEFATSKMFCIEDARIQILAQEVR